MRIKLTLRGRGPSDIDLLVTTDNTATIGDIAATLATAGPEGAAPAIDPESVTLRLLEPASGRVIATLSPSSYVTETGLRSGALVDISGGDQAVSSGEIAAEVRVLEGPDRGMRITLPFGAATIGRTQDCTITLNDPMVSKKHARVTVGAAVEIQDCNSVNGVVVGSERIQRRCIEASDIITLGASRLQIVQLRKPDLGSTDSTDIAFVRPPQVIPHISVKQIRLPDPPVREKPTRFPFIALISPILAAGVMYMVTQQLMTLVFVAMSPILMLGNWWDQRRQSRIEAKNSRADFNAGMKTVRQELEAHRKAEIEARSQQYPPVEQMIASALRRDGALWLRRPEHPEFLSLRLGVGTDLAAVDFETSGNGQGVEECIDAVKSLHEEFRTVEEVPVVVNLRSEGGLGIFGQREWMQQVQAALAAQLATQYSPAELIIACLTSSRNLHAWEWLEWLPHVTSPHSPLGNTIHLSADEKSSLQLLSALEGLLEMREGAATANTKERGPRLGGDARSDGEDYPKPVPAVVVFIDEPLVDRARLNRVAELGPDRGVYVVWSAEDYSALPAACRSFIAVEEGSVSVGEVRNSRVLHRVRADRVRHEDVLRLARSLSPVIDAGVPVNDDSDLPGAISYVSLTGKELADTPEAVIEHWRAGGSLVNRSPGALIEPGEPVSLAALVGQESNGPMHLDLRSHGPHALVGGTTGAGKSEFLQAWVLGMAQAVSPDRLTFLFVDYKGGAAFARCTELPHCVGLVTDLSPYLVRRALTSLRAELHYREKLLNEKGAKDLVTLEKRGDPECPPSLVIVVDEFAALVNEVPEFVDGVVDVAQRGRSLGLHLILATQRPAGVIKDNLRANTNLRVALRMADTDDSQDVLGDPMAAHFPQSSPGRGAVKTGPGRITVFQSAYPGAKTTEENKGVAVGVEELGFGYPKPWRTPDRPALTDDVDSDIDRVVSTLQRAADIARVPMPRKPWLPDLAPTYDLTKLNQRRDTELLLGVIDVPEKQSQESEYFLPDRDGNIAYYGASGSGKTSALRSLAIAAAITPKSGPVHVYALDFAGGGLDMLSVMPHVGDVIHGDDEERVFRLIDLIADTVEERAMRYSAVHASDLTAYRRISANEEEPRLLLLVDGIGPFADLYQSTGRHLKLWTRFQQILLDGRGVGVHAAVTADRPQAMPNALASNFQRKVVLRLTDEDAYLYFGLPRDVLDSSSLPGRAMQVGRADLMQLAILGDNINPLAQSRQMQALGASPFLAERKRPVPIRALPTDIDGSSVVSSVDGQPVLGIEASTLEPVSFRPTGTFALSGGPQSGRTSTMKWLFKVLKATYPAAVFLHASARRSRLAKEPGWTAVAQGADKIAGMLYEHKGLFEQEAEANAPEVILFVEEIGEFSFSSCEQVLQDVVAGAKANAHLVIAEADLSGWSFGGSVCASIRSGRSGLVLCPSQGEGESAVGTPVPGLYGKEITPGRGYFVQGGKMLKVQIPRI